jgi:hypothetical protein
VISSLVETVVELLDTPIHIPVLSDILNEFGVPDFSFLDIACWIASVPANLLYKAVHGVTPFPDDAHTTFLIDTKDYATLLAAFQNPGPQPLHTAIASAAAASEASGREPMVRMAPPVTPSGPTLEIPPIPDAASRPVFITLQLVSGFCCLISAVVSGFEAAMEADWPLRRRCWALWGVSQTALLACLCLTTRSETWTSRTSASR